MSTLTAVPILDFSMDRAMIERELDRLLVGPDRGPVHEAMRYAVFGAGQRIRPLLAMRVARLIGGDARDALASAAAVELFHCASLIVDDLPCMDNAKTRRGRACTHLMFNESTAILAAFALVALAARSVIHLPKFQRRLLATLDCGSLIAGQSLDLTDLKTVPLFELAVQAGGAASRRFAACEHQLMRFGREFGLAFQLVDDLMDGDLADQGVAQRQIDAARTVAGSLAELLPLIDLLQAKISEANHCNR